MMFLLLCVLDTSIDVLLEPHEVSVLLEVYKSEHRDAACLARPRPCRCVDIIDI